MGDQRDTIELKLDALLWLCEEIKNGTGDAFTKIHQLAADKSIDDLEMLIEKKFVEEPSVGGSNER